jgi:ferredoxin-NADP reductase
MAKIVKSEPLDRPQYALLLSSLPVGDDRRRRKTPRGEHGREPTLFPLCACVRQSSKTPCKAPTSAPSLLLVGPRGSFPLHQDLARPAVFLARGIVIAPVRSILQQAAQQHVQHKMYLFYSNRNVDDAAFLEEIEHLSAQNHNLLVIPTLTGGTTLAWPFEKGHINRDMLKRYLLALQVPVYCISGPSGMVTAMTTLLQNAGVSKDNMKVEEFGDYKLYGNVEQHDPSAVSRHSDSGL